MNVALRTARKNAKFTQERLADVSGVDQTTISRIEVTSSQPSGDTKARLAAALNVSVEQLFPPSTNETAVQVVDGAQPVDERRSGDERRAL